MDKAVSTEDLGVEMPRNASLDAARLEAVIKTLLENKVEALKNEKGKSSSMTSSPKSLINRFRITSTSSVSSKDREEVSTHSQTSRYSRKYGCQNEDSISKKTTTKMGYVTPNPNHSPKSIKLQHSKVHNCERILHFSEEDGNDNNYGFLHRNVCVDQQCASMLDCSDNCCCRRETNGEIRMHFDDDYISLKIEECDDMDDGEVANQRALRRAQRKRRRRRKRRMKKAQKAMTAITVPVVNETFKEIDPDELSKRARWTIVITACLLLFMCLLLVGITLRMAPIIDDMVRKENEELMNSLSGETKIYHNSLHNSTASVPSTTN